MAASMAEKRDTLQDTDGAAKKRLPGARDSEPVVPHGTGPRVCVSGDPVSETIVKRYTVDICDPCMRLEGEMCDTPGCIFCWCTMAEVSEYLNRMLIRPIVDGEQFESLQEGEQV